MARERSAPWTAWRLRSGEHDIGEPEHDWIAPTPVASYGLVISDSLRLRRHGQWQLENGEGVECCWAARAGPGIPQRLRKQSALIGWVMVEGDWWERIFLPWARSRMRASRYAHIKVLRFTADLREWAWSQPDESERWDWFEFGGGFVGTEDRALQDEGARMARAANLVPLWTDRTGYGALVYAPAFVLSVFVERRWWKRKWLPYARRHLDLRRYRHIKVHYFTKAQLALKSSNIRYGIVATDSLRLEAIGRAEMEKRGLTSVLVGLVPSLHDSSALLAGQVDAAFAEGDWWERVWLPLVRANAAEVLKWAAVHRHPESLAAPGGPRAASPHRAQALFRHVEMLRFSETDLAIKDRPCLGMIVTNCKARLHAARARLFEAGCLHVWSHNPSIPFRPNDSDRLRKIKIMLVEGNWWETEGQLHYPARRLDPSATGHIEFLRFTPDEMALQDDPDDEMIRVHCIPATYVLDYAQKAPWRYIRRGDLPGASHKDDGEPGADG